MSSKPSNAKSVRRLAGGWSYRDEEVRESDGSTSPGDHKRRRLRGGDPRRKCDPLCPSTHDDTDSNTLFPHRHRRRRIANLKPIEILDDSTDSGSDPGPFGFDFDVGSIAGDPFFQFSEYLLDNNMAALIVPPEKLLDVLSCPFVFAQVGNLAGSRDDAPLPPLFFWNGEYHYLPKNFQFGKGLCFKDLIRDWLIGREKPIRLPPYYVLKGKDVAQVGESARKRFYEMKKLMELVKKIGMDKGVWKGDTKRCWDEDSISKLYFEVVNEIGLPAAVGGRKEKRRIHGISWSTVYNNEVRYKEKKQKICWWDYNY